MSKLDGKFCEWCDQPAKRSYGLRGHKSLRVYACGDHLKLAFRHARDAQSAASGSLADEVEKSRRAPA